MVEDRFKKVASTYQLFTEIFSEQGLDYGEFQHSVLDAVSKFCPDYKEARILDIGTGHGDTILPFLEVGCTNLTGLDLNPEMVKIARERLGNKVKIILADAIDMSMFKEGEFDVIISAATIHNIPLVERPKFWKELLRLKPNLIILSEKIVNKDEDRHKQEYNSEIEAIKKVGGEHNLPDLVKEWVEHYEYDERERLENGEILEFLSRNYEISSHSRRGMFETIVAVKK